MPNVQNKDPYFQDRRPTFYLIYAAKEVLETFSVRFDYCIVQGNYTRHHWGIAECREKRKKSQKDMFLIRQNAITLKFK